MRSLIPLCCLFFACAGPTAHIAHVAEAAEPPRETFERQGYIASAAVVLPDGEEHCFGDCETRHSPASTFKVPHALIALDAGVLSGPRHLFAWDGEERSVGAWNQDHTLASAIQHSVVWYFQRVAPLVGRPRFETSLRRFHYGNASVGADLTRFWLDDSLTISPMEQARFWRRLHHGEVPVSAEARDSVLDMSVLARDGQSVLRGKTGWHPSAPVGGWFVGSLESEAGVVTVAVRLTASAEYDVASFLSARRLVADGLLEEVGFTVPH